MKIVYFLMAVPALIIIGLFILVPVLYNFGISFTNTSLMRKGVDFVLFDNFINFFKDKNTPVILKNTFHYTFVVVTFQFMIGFITAFLLSGMTKGRALSSAILFMPWVVSQILAATAWTLLFSDSYGIVNYFLKGLGLAPVGWFSNLSIIFYTVMGLNIWCGYAFTMTIMLSALKSVPPELYEASAVDGANGIQRLFYITIPSISYSISTTLILITVYTFNVFTVVFALTGGGPLNKTEVIGVTMYNAAFRSGRLGYAASIAMVMIVFNLVLALLYIRSFRNQNT